MITQAKAREWVGLGLFFRLCRDSVGIPEEASRKQSSLSSRPHIIPYVFSVVLFSQLHLFFQFPDNLSLNPWLQFKSDILSPFALTTFCLFSNFQIHMRGLLIEIAHLPGQATFIQLLNNMELPNIC